MQKEWHTATKTFKVNPSYIENECEEMKTANLHLKK
jgi:hypothetical protein